MKILLTDDLTIMSFKGKLIDFRKTFRIIVFLRLNTNPFTWITLFSLNLNPYYFDVYRRFDYIPTQADGNKYCSYIFCIRIVFSCVQWMYGNSYIRQMCKCKKSNFRIYGINVYFCFIRIFFCNFIDKQCILFNYNLSKNCDYIERFYI